MGERGYNLTFKKGNTMAPQSIEPAAHNNVVLAEAQQEPKADEILTLWSQSDLHYFDLGKQADEAERAQDYALKKLRAVYSIKTLAEFRKDMIATLAPIEESDSVSAKLVRTRIAASEQAMRDFGNGQEGFGQIELDGGQWVEGNTDILDDLSSRFGASVCSHYRYVEKDIRLAFQTLHAHITQPDRQ